MSAAGIGVVVPDGWEADDVLASGAALAGRSGWRCTVLTSDRDSFALIDDTTCVLRLLDGGVEGSPLLTPGRLRLLCGVRAGQYTDFAALRGDSSDNLPGAVGIGPKAAAKPARRVRRRRRRARRPRRRPGRRGRGGDRRRGHPAARRPHLARERRPQPAAHDDAPRPADAGARRPAPAARRAPPAVGARRAGPRPGPGAVAAHRAGADGGRGAGRGRARGRRPAAPLACLDADADARAGEGARTRAGRRAGSASSADRRGRTVRGTESGRLNVVLSRRPATTAGPSTTRSHHDHPDHLDPPRPVRAGSTASTRWCVAPSAR
nr:hypothetical protein [Angustibacter aerolatus]